MTCGHCQQSVTGEMSKIDGVTDVAVDLAKGKVTVTSTEPLGDGALRAAVDEAGFEVVG